MTTIISISQGSSVVNAPHQVNFFSRWRDQMETFSTLLVLCEGNPPVTGRLPSQRPVKRSFDVFFDLHLNKRLSKQSKTNPGDLRRHGTHYDITVIWSYVTEKKHHVEFGADVTRQTVCMRAIVDCVSYSLSLYASWDTEMYASFSRAHIDGNCTCHPHADIPCGVSCKALRASSRTPILTSGLSPLH